MKLGIVVSETYWDDITSRMLELAKKTAQSAEIMVVKVPGSFDIPFAVKKIIDEVDGVVTLGAVIQGETDHDVVIMNSVAKKILDISVKYGKPVTLGINGPRINREQAISRIKRAEAVTKACMKLIK